MINKKALLVLAGILIVVGLTRPDLSNILVNRPAKVDNLELSQPADETVFKEAKDVIVIAKTMPKAEARKLRDLYLDIKQLIKLDGEDEVIKNTEEIRQANSIAGSMLKLDLKGKYPDLAKELKDVVVTAIGDDQMILSPELRVKAADSFDALAWALNEGSK